MPIVLDTWALLAHLRDEPAGERVRDAWFESGAAMCSINVGEVLYMEIRVRGDAHGLMWSAPVFNYLIGNCDAHGKNFSLLYESRSPRLAPLYDLVSTEVRDLSRVLAMSIDGAGEIFETRRHSWERLARDIGFSGLYARQTLEELGARVVKEAEDLASRPEHDAEVVGAIVSGIRRRIQAIQQPIGWSPYPRAGGEYRLSRVMPSPNEGLVDWLLARPDKGYFVAVESEATDTL